MNSFNDIFELMKSQLDITDTAMKLWIEPIKPIKLNNNKVVLYVPAVYAKNLIEQNYVNKFKAIFKDILGFDVEIELLCDNDLTAEQKLKYCEPIPELQDDIDMTERLEKSVAGSEYKHTFETFIVGDSNKLAYAACKAVAQGQTNNYNPLFIYSEPGLGKTHLLSAVKNEILARKPNTNVIYIAAETFTNDFVQAIKTNTTDKFKEKYRGADVLLVDDVQFISGKEETQQELFHTFNELHRLNKQIIFTSDRPPKEMNNIEERLLTRFEWGLLADISLPEFETRIAIVKRKAELFEMNIPDNVVEYIADKLKHNIRQLEGAIVKMNALSLVTGVPPTISMAQNTIRDILSDHEPIPVTVEKIINEVAHIYSVSPDEMRSQKRSAQISTARQVAIYVVSRITHLSYTAIGVEFGNRDHSTIVYAINKVKSIIKKDTSYRATIDDLIKNLGNN